jgi:hypothetical protein
MSNEPDELPPDPDLLPEYDFSASRSSPYADRFYKKHGLVRLDPDIVDFFPDVASINETLRAVADIIRVREKSKNLSEAR